MWKCPNGCKINTVLVCGGSLSDDPNAPNKYFQMTTKGKYTNMFHDGTVGVPQECYDHADGGCCEEPQCPECNAYCIQVQPANRKRGCRQ